MSGIPMTGYSMANGLAPLTKLGVDGAPIQGPRAIPFVLAFSASINNIPVELFQENADKQLDFVQTLYLDNSLSMLALSVRSLIFNQVLTIPAQSQAYLPILSILDSQSQFVFSKAAVGSENIPIQFINVPMPAIVWKVI